LGAHVQCAQHSRFDKILLKCLIPALQCSCALRPRRVSVSSTHCLQHRVRACGVCTLSSADCTAIHAQVASKFEATHVLKAVDRSVGRPEHAGYQGARQALAHLQACQHRADQLNVAEHSIACRRAGLHGSVGQGAAVWQLPATRACTQTRLTALQETGARGGLQNNSSTITRANSGTRECPAPCKAWRAILPFRFAQPWTL